MSGNLKNAKGKIWNRDDVIRDYLRKVSVLRKNLPFETKLNFEFNGRYFERDTLEKAGWHITDEGFYRNVFTEVEETAGESGDDAPKREYYFTCHFAKTADTIYTAKNKLPKECAKAVNSGRLMWLDVSAFDEERESLPSSPVEVPEKVQNAVLLDLRRAALTSKPLGIKALLRIVKDHVTYRSDAVRSSHDEIFGALRHCMANALENENDYPNANASVRGLLVPIVRALAGCDKDDDTAYAINFDEADLFLQFMELAARTAFGEAVQIIAASFLVKFWDSLDTAMGTEEWAALAESMAKTSQHVLAVVGYANAWNNIYKVLKSPHSFYVHGSYTVAHYLQTFPEEDRLGELRYVRKLADTFEDELDHVREHKLLMILFDAYIDKLEGRSVSAAIEQVRNLIEVERTKLKDDNSSQRDYPPGVSMPLLWQALLALKNDLLEAALLDFPSPFLGEPEKISYRMPMTPVNGPYPLDLWSGILPEDADPKDFGEVVSTMTAAKFAKNEDDPCYSYESLSPLDQQEDDLHRAILIRGEATPVRIRAPRVEVKVVRVDALIDSAKEWDDANPNNVDIYLATVFPWPVLTHRKNASNVKTATVWEWYPWMHSAAADLRIMLNHSDSGVKMLCVSVPYYLETRMAIVRGMAVEMFVFALVMGNMHLKVAGDGIDVPDTFVSTEIPTLEKASRSNILALAKVESIEPVHSSPLMASVLCANGKKNKLMRVLVTADNFPFPLPIFVSQDRIEDGVEEGSLVVFNAILMADVRGTCGVDKETFKSRIGEDGVPFMPLLINTKEEHQEEPKEIFLVECRIEISEALNSSEKMAETVGSLSNGDPLVLRRIPPASKDGSRHLVSVQTDEGEELGLLPHPHTVIFANLIDAGKHVVARLAAITLNHGTVSIDVAVFLAED
ncbi:MAG: HIRAN domain-containing protein [Kiritimatiellae bacterium]|nr:HIRAN domain-containing protein [Kiritimatiellia bacterium]